MKPPLWMFHVNRPDLTERAYRSVADHFSVVIINNNSETDDLPFCPSKYKPPIPFTFRQSHALILRWAQAQRLSHYYWMHNDAEALEDTPAKLIAFVEAQQQPWGAVFTNYDTLAAFSVEALAAIGGWSDLFEQYFLDNHTYRLLAQNGWPTLETGLPVAHHCDASATIKSCPRRKARNGLTFPLYEQLYCKLWGGPPGHESLSEPLLR